MSDMLFFVQVTFSISQEGSGPTIPNASQILPNASPANSMPVQETFSSQDTSDQRPAQLLIRGICCCLGTIPVATIYIEAPLPPRCNSPNEADGHDDDDDDDDDVKALWHEVAKA